jgi:hypothetical protein
MADSFSIHHITHYLRQMGVKIAHLDERQDIIELAFHGHQGQWRMIIGMQQKGDLSKLLLIVPHFGTLTATRRTECLAALMAVNYRIAMGKFSLDLEDGEIRLEETIPLAHHSISFEQFRLAFSSVMQTLSIYHSLLPRIIYGNLSAEEALQRCEQDFIQEYRPDGQREEPLYTHADACAETVLDKNTDLDVNEILAEVTNLLEQHKE